MIEDLLTEGGFLTACRDLVARCFAVVLIGSGLATLTVSTDVGRARAAAACSSLELIGARSSSDLVPGGDYSADPTHGLGALLHSVLTTVSGFAGTTTVSSYGVHYPASALPMSVSEWLDPSGAARHVVPPAAYVSSQQTGTADVLAHLNDQHVACPTERFLLAGYGEGAGVVGDAISSMPAELRAAVAGATLFADPSFDAQSSSAVSASADHSGMLGARTDWPADVRPRVVSYCERFDPVCGLSLQQPLVGGGSVSAHDLAMLATQGFAAHQLYASDGTAQDAGRRLARLGGLSTPVAGALPLDIAFAVDSTSSMQVTLPAVEAEVTALVQHLSAISGDVHFGLVDYKDDPADDAAYQARTDVSFTSDPAALTAGFASIVPTGGADTAESVSSGVIQALGLPWRPDAHKVLVVIGDALGKDPEPVTGYTGASVHAAALAAGVSISTVASIPAVETIDYMARLAADNGGTSMVAPDQTTFVSTIEGGALTSGTAPTADAGGPYQTVKGLPLALTAGMSRDPAEDVAGYDWDLDGDGAYETTTIQPVLVHSFTAVGSHPVGLRIRSASGLSALATTTVEVDPAPLQVRPPLGLTATPGSSSATLSWQASVVGGAPAWFTIHGAGGVVLDRFTVLPDVPPSWVDAGLMNGTPYTYGVSAGNASGESATTGLVTVTPVAPPTIALPPGAPSAPRALVVQPHNRSLLVSWAPPTSAAAAVRSYVVTWRKHGVLSHISSQTVPGSALSLNLTGLQNDLRWDVSVVATGASGRGPEATGHGVPRLPAGDYDGDGRTDLAVYESSSGTWTIHARKPVQVGKRVIPVPGDYNGDGKTDIAGYNPRTGSWTIRGHKPTHVGKNLIPVAGDYNGDGKTDIAVYNPRTGSWTIRGHKPTHVSKNLIPVSGDYNGDGKTDIAVYNPRNGAWSIRGHKPTQVGKNIVPVAADYNGDGTTDLAVYNPRTGDWNVHGHKRSHVGRRLVPVPADYNGDGKAELAVYNPHTGFWTVRASKPAKVGKHALPLVG